MQLFIQIYMYINIFIIGTLFGSFFTLATYRIPRKQDIVKTRSYCPVCKHKLNFWDLIPILSYVFHLGKCKYCKCKISIRYPLFELFSGIAFVLMYAIFGLSINFILAIILYTAMFLNTGCYIMNKKYITEKVNELKKENNSNKKTNSKKGVFISEIIVAMLLFAIVIGTSNYMARNNISKELENISNANAKIECVKNIELALSKSYDELNSFDTSIEIDGILYTTTVDVKKISDEDFSKKDYIKTIDCKCEYYFKGELKECTMSTIKKREI